MKLTTVVFCAILTLLPQASSTRFDEADRKEVLAMRERVWHAWFGGDTKYLATVLPPELITLDSTPTFGTLESNLRDAKAFADGGGRLTRVAFPRTEFQVYGPAVILYTTYEIEFVVRGAAQAERGTAIEVFARQKGRWTHTGWQLARSQR